MDFTLDNAWASILLQIRKMLCKMGASSEQLNRLDAHIANVLDVEYPEV